ncbi:hypothetical protein FA13DRAFT_245682 [Coprinellus micaceus]|uniref:Uncharacterized protein n=1 Tax=Coprinellus micaceus TaxID=71717 RepID=A0A4Y7SEI8_COPMI|nr:hypothetical protein FA13DRAFT_245682 [Coprinellus micaceus]
MAVQMSERKGAQLSASSSVVEEALGGELGWWWCDSKLGVHTSHQNALAPFLHVPHLQQDRLAFKSTPVEYFQSLKGRAASIRPTKHTYMVNRDGSDTGESRTRLDVNGERGEKRSRLLGKRGLRSSSTGWSSTRCLHHRIGPGLRPLLNNPRPMPTHRTTSRHFCWSRNVRLHSTGTLLSVVERSRIPWRLSPLTL